MPRKCVVFPWLLTTGEMVTYLNSYPGCVVEIFNRNGQRVFQSTGYSKPWDGTFNGKPLPVGTYYYVIDTKRITKKLAGYVTILK